MLLCGLFMIAFGLAGCSSSWRAPVETRGHAATPSRSPSRNTIRGDEYRVRAGDTLYGIAWQKGIDYRSIAAWNGIRSPAYRIYAGQTLRLVPPASTRQPPRPASQPAPRYKPVPRPAPKPLATAQKPKPTVSSKAQPSAPKRLSWRWPAKGRVVSSFKADDPLQKGIKIAGRSGEPVVATESGKVVYSGSGLIGYGRLIIIKHNDNYLSAYGHNRKILVKEGDQVTKGKKIAEMGTANSGDPMLHFEIRRNGKPVDPLRLLPRR
jgi:lipoprotein NlpD